MTFTNILLLLSEVAAEGEVSTTSDGAVSTTTEGAVSATTQEAVSTTSEGAVSTTSTFKRKKRILFPNIIDHYKQFEQFVT